MARSRPPVWLVALIVVVAVAGIAVVTQRTLGDDTNGSGGGSGHGSEGQGANAATMQGTARSVETAGRIRLTSLSIDLGAGQWTLSGGGGATHGSGAITVQGDGIVADLFRTVVTPTGATFALHGTSVAVPDHALVNGQTVSGSHLQLQLFPDGPMTWLDAPAVLTLESVDQFSWAGSGSIAVAGQTLTGEHLGAMGTMNVTLTRAGDAVAVAATGTVQQAFVDGQPALRTTATVDRIRTDVTVHPGDKRPYVTWAPRATGQYGLCILRISPRSGPADWVNVGLQHMPPMFGGELHAPVGGDTSGLGDNGSFLGGADAIDSFIAVGQADRRDLSLTVPPGTAPGVYTIEIAIEGNFDPVVFRMTVKVAG